VSTQLRYYGLNIGLFSVYRHFLDTLTAYDELKSCVGMHNGNESAPSTFAGIGLYDAWGDHFDT
jgi:hypothetical protein